MVTPAQLDPPYRCCGLQALFSCMSSTPGREHDMVETFSSEHPHSQTAGFVPAALARMRVAQQPHTASL